MKNPDKVSSCNKRWRDKPENKAKINATRRAWTAKNKKRVLARNKKTYDRNMIWVRAYKTDRGCSKCLEKDERCLDFHHLDPGKKTYGIAQIAWGASLDRLAREVENCVILCSNCHRKTHIRKAP